MQKSRTKNRIIRIISLIIALTVMGVIFFFSNQPGSESDEVSISFASLLFSADLGTILNSLVRKFAHLLEYMALGAPLYLFLYTYRKGEVFSCTVSIALSSLYAISDELHQMLVPGRACQISDMVLDSLGAALCIMILHWILKPGKKAGADGTKDIYGKFMEVCSCYLSGKLLEFDTLSQEETRDIFTVAANQKLLPVVYSMLKKQNKLDPSDGFVQEQKNKAIGQIVAQTVKSEEFLDVYEKMISAGVKPVCVKGIICRSFYSQPDHRPSCDEDLIVREENRSICVQVLKDNGYTVSSDQPEEMAFVDMATGSIIELHSSCFGNGTAILKKLNDAMGDVYNNAEFVEYSGRKILGPGADDHLLYMIFHAYKHFIGAGVGIRQIMDIAIFAQKNTIDYKVIWERSRTAGAEIFTSAVMAISGKYFGLDLDPVKAANPSFDENEDIDLILNDILSGGVYGGGLDRRHAASVTSTDNNSFLRAVFPRKEQIEKRYPVLKKHGWLLPAVWVKRIALFVFDENSEGTLGEAKRRLELVKKYSGRC